MKQKQVVLFSVQKCIYGNVRVVLQELESVKMSVHLRLSSEAGVTEE